MTEEQNDFMPKALSGAGVAAVTYLVYAIRSYGTTRRIDIVGLLIGLVSAGLVGALTMLAMEGFHMSPELSAVITAMAGYTGGTLLDMYYDAVKTLQRSMNKEVEDTVHAAGESIRERIKKHDGKNN